MDKVKQCRWIGMQWCSARSAMIAMAYNAQVLASTRTRFAAPSVAKRRARASRAGARHGQG